MSSDAFTAITIICPDESEMLVRLYEDERVEVDVRVKTSKFGPRVWTPVALLGGSFTVTQHQNVDYGAAS